MKWPGHGTAGALFAAVMLIWLAGCFAYVDAKAMQLFTLDQ